MSSFSEAVKLEAIRKASLCDITKVLKTDVRLGRDRKTAFQQGRATKEVLFLILDPTKASCAFEEARKGHNTGAVIAQSNKNPPCDVTALYWLHVKRTDVLGKLNDSLDVFPLML